jgi:hypothetical protein
VFKALLASVAVIAALACVPANAGAVDGLTQRSAVTAKDHDPTKSVKAYCPDDMYVLGGGGEIRDDGHDIARMTSLHPVSPGGLDYFEASAETFFEGQYEPWSLAAFAICAPESSLDDYHVAAAQYINQESDPYVKGSVGCRGDTVAYSAGASILDFVPSFKGRIGLQMVRTSGPLDIARATARENGPLDTPNPWWFYVYAVCAKKQGDIHVEGAGDPDGDLEVTSFCNDYVHGAGGGASGPGISDAGRSWIKSIVPSHALRSMTATMVGPDQPRGGVVTSHTCAEGH